MDVTSRSLYIENFPLDTEDETLRSLFGRFGKIKRLEVPKFSPEHPLCRGLKQPKSKGFAFVEYCNKTDADNAHNFFNDLNNILSESNDAQKSCDDKQLGEDIFNDSQCKRFQLLRVMLKQTFLDFTRQYEDQRFQSLVRVAKSLVV